MFTGIIAATGQLRATSASHLVFETPELAPRLQLGGSIAVNGCCLTVVRADEASFEVDVVPETLARTNLGQLQAGARVNLELPCTPSTALDGHLVQGHVDGTAVILEVAEVELGREIRIGLPASLARYVAEKGSVALDGTSLTVKGVEADAFSVAMIPHTLALTIAGTYRPGQVVNLEVDVIARYTERLLEQQDA